MISDEKGYALPLVFVIMLVLAMLSTALWFYGTSETTQVSRQEKRARAYYYALSGIGVTENILDADEGINLLKTSDSPFYLSGPLGSGPYDWDLAFTEPANGVDVAVEVNYEKVSDGLITGEIISEGHYLGITRIIKRDFFYLMTASAMELGWYRTQGNANRIHWGDNIDRDVDCPVEFVTADNEAIVVNAADENYLAAPAIFFAIEPDSIDVTNKNAMFTLRSNYIFFDGNIVFQGNVGDTGALALEVRDEILSAAEHLITVENYEDYLEPLDGSSLGDIFNLDTDGVPDPDVYFGLLRIGNEEEGTERDIYTVQGSSRTPVRNDLGTGWYLFPKLEGGLNLANSTHLGKLIRITDISQFDLIMFSLGLNLGAYR